jgi:hypothetical protein
MSFIFVPPLQVSFNRVVYLLAGGRSYSGSLMLDHVVSKQILRLTGF